MPMPRPKSNVRESLDAPMVDETLRGWVPHIHDHLTEQVWEDGKRRMTSTLLIFCEGGMWKARLNDRAVKISAWVSGESWEALLEAIERGLAAESLEWRADRK